MTHRCVNCGYVWGVIDGKIVTCRCPDVARMRGRGFYCTAWNGVLYVMFQVIGESHWSRWEDLKPATRTELFARSAWGTWAANA